MDIILVPGFWLDGASWDDVAGPLRAAGHRVTALTLPGLESIDADRSTVSLADHVDAVVEAIDAAGGPVALVGHSGGGPIAWAAADARVAAVSGLVFVDTGPLGSGSSIGGTDGAPVPELPLPDWAEFDESSLRDLTPELRARFAAIAKPEPGRVNTDHFDLHDPRRFAVSTTVVACSIPSTMLREWMTAKHPYMTELADVQNVEFVDLPTGHWPQFTKPRELADLIDLAVRTPSGT